MYGPSTSTGRRSDVSRRTTRLRGPTTYAVGDGDNRHDVEKYLSAVESDTAPVITKLLGDAQAVEENDKRVLSYVAAPADRPVGFDLRRSL